MEFDEETGLLDMKQTGLVDHVINAVGLGNGMDKGKYTLSVSVPLVKNKDVVPISGIFNYRSVVGIMIYLSGHTRPDIAFLVNCCTKYMFCPKHSYEEALKRIGRYLKLTRYCRLILNLNR